MKFLLGGRRDGAEVIYSRKKRGFMMDVYIFFVVSLSVSSAAFFKSVNLNIRTQPSNRNEVGLMMLCCQRQSKDLRLIYLLFNYR